MIIAKLLEITSHFAVERMNFSRPDKAQPPSGIAATHSVITNRVAAKQFNIRCTRNTIVNVASSATVTEVMR